jgi:hypothetical protein
VAEATNSQGAFLGGLALALIVFSVLAVAVVMVAAMGG